MILTRTTTTRGEPPLEKLQKKFTYFVSEVDKDEDNYNDCEKLARAFLEELTTFKIPCWSLGRNSFRFCCMWYVAYI
jgi:THO complex subunit 7